MGTRARLTSTPPVISSSASNGNAKSSFSTASTCVIGLAIVPIRVKAKGKHKMVKTYAFLDSGSNTLFCTEVLLERLDLQGTKTLSLTTLESENEPIVCSLVSLEAFHLDQSNAVQLPKVYSRPSLPIPSEAIAKQEDVNRWPYLKGVKIKGSNQEFNDSSYELKVSMSLNDQKALNIMKETVKLQNGHYEMALPWKFYPPRLQNNRTLAERRLLQLKRRLQRESLVHQKYKAFMDDLLSNDYARKVTRQDPGPLGTHWYLHHHPVFSPQKPGKVRVVFDCSAKYCNTSLNHQLLQGPDLTNSLVGMLSRFREDYVALMSDVEAMFHQVRVRPSDCDTLRFLWWLDGNLDNQPEEYQMRVHLFGGASSPSCANFALKRTAEDNKDYDPQTIETVKRNFYVETT